MTLLHLIVLSLVQGIAEFLPISSSAHLVLVPIALQVPDQGIVIDIASHVGTLLAVLLYCHKDLAMMARGALETVRTGRLAPSRLAIYIAVATIPAVIFGYLIYEMMPTGIRNIEIMGWNLILFGILLYAADRSERKYTTINEMTMKSALIIGFAQMLALIPGTSRSGVTMTAARFLKFDRVTAARFSILLGIPATAGATVLGMRDLLQSGNDALLTDALMVIALTFVFALGALHFMMRWLARQTFTPFVIYRVVLGLVLLTYVYVYAA